MKLPSIKALKQMLGISSGTTIKQSGEKPSQLSKFLWEGAARPTNDCALVVWTGCSGTISQAAMNAIAARLAPQQAGYECLVVASLVPGAGEQDQPRWRVLDIVHEDGTPLVERVAKAFPEATLIPVTLTRPTPTPTATLAEIHRHLGAQRNVVLQGPPGTGKTWLAHQLMLSLARKPGDTTRDTNRRLQTGRLGQLLETHGTVDLLEKEHQETIGALPVVWESLQMHPGYAYEDFVRGLTTAAGELGFVPRDGVLVQMARVAALRPDKPTVLLLDEINRCDLASVFGELIVLIERDKRIPQEDTEGGLRIRLTTPPPAGSLTALGLPENLWLLGTMNTADRSTAMVDYAVRRRFRFLDVRPDKSVLDTYYAGHQDKLDRVSAIFEYVDSLVEDQDFSIGHSYFLEDPRGRNQDWERRLRNKIRYELMPQLEAYDEARVLAAEAGWREVLGGLLEPPE